MRKLLLIISMVTLVAMSDNVQAQDARFGVKMGPSFDWASAGSVASKNEGLGLGFNLGVVYDHYFTNYMAVSSGLNFNFLRMKYMFTDYRYVNEFLEPTDVAVSRRVKTANIEIPLKMKFKMDVMGSLKAYMEAGVGLSFNSRDRAKDTYDFYWESVSSNDYEDCTSQYRLLQASIIFGLGAELEINSKFSAFAQLTFDHSLSNAFVNSLEKQTGSLIRNNFLGIEVGIMH